MALGAAILGCSPVISTHGFAPPDEQLSEIAVGQDTRGSVRRKIGRPGLDGVFTDEGWYYVSSTVERLTWHEPKVTDRRIVAIAFDENDTVTAINRYGLDDGRLVDLETRTTPTRGRDLTVLQQLLGNIGNISADQVLQDQ
ncbi:outer membrane protein assembly factor BamE [Limibaculum sp. M0105]|uniref:Outer membrane protein assembly factor BamE n=1 Tax=Thermohalobaculum xanthum TaxID=2753746 RepID=A0A8J7M4X7_9RHOB|nr:outer membrane protein assembly factor BamE [Thermohalobaculum xanthum]MBK0398391.1 outer membrane protein assembly factor BamE [Thermohalobaculum xanthum]